ncbi:MAG TPA: serine/threonine-protein kinase [Bryobacteraceae bacterium]|jgi:serine/threonine protein kinase
MGFDSEHWTELQALFHLAEETPESERERVLSAACSDPQILERALEILRASDEAAQPSSPPTTLGKIGPYQLIRHLGTGGTGSVYLAERVAASVIQRAAVKVLAPHAAGAGFVERFEREQRILASLEHPNIVRMQDAGVTSAGQPYLVMEYVDGLHLDDYCDREKLGIEARLRLFLTICDAVEYAHRNLVVHLDLKPSNLLVTAGGVAKLLDFGTSKLLEIDGRYTSTLMVTPAYASPEQLRNEAVTTACDVYSLGVILFELLAGRRPESDGNISSGWMKTDEHWREPESPDAAVTSAAASQRRTTEHRLRAQLAGDLSTMIRKCLRQVPDERYSSVRALADDLTRYLEGRPVLARPQTTLYQVSKFVRRNRGRVSVAALLMIALAGSLFIAWQGQRRALEEAQRAVRMQDFMYRLFKTANGNAIGKPEPTLRDFLKFGADLMPQQLHDPQDLRQAQLSFAQSMHRNSDYESATKLLNTVVASARASGDVASEAEALGTLGVTAFYQGRNTEALADVKQALELSRRPEVPVERRFFIAQQYVIVQSDLAGSSAAILDILAGAIREARDKKVDPSDIAEAQTYLAGSDVNLGRLAEADAAYTEALQTYDRIDPNDSCGHALVWGGMAGVRRGQNRPAEAAELSQKSYEGRAKCWGTDAPYTRIQLTFLGDAWVEMGRAAQAVDLLKKEEPYWRKPPINKSLTYQYLRSLGYAYVEAKQFPAAEKALRDAFDLFGKDLAPMNKRLATLHLYWAQALAGMGRNADALPHAESALRIFGQPITPAGIANVEKTRRLIADLTPSREPPAPRPNHTPLR